MTRLTDLITRAKTGMSVSERLLLGLTDPTGESITPSLDVRLNELYRLLLHADLHDPDQDDLSHDLGCELRAVSELLKS